MPARSLTTRPAGGGDSPGGGGAVVGLVGATMPGARGRLRRAARRAGRVLPLLPLLGCALVYGQVHRLVAWADLPRIDPVLLAADRALLGGDPAVWWLRHGSGPATDLLALCYLGYNLVVAAVAVAAVARRPPPAAWGLVRPMVATYLIGYGLYVLLPATPPHAVLADVLGPGAGGGWLTALQDRCTELNPNAGNGAFPSLHCAVTLVAVLLSRRLGRGLFLALLPPSVGLVPAVLLLGHHYVADVVAGVLLGLAVHAASPGPAAGPGRHLT